MSYTSGTTGDSKGVKLTNRMIMMTCQEVIKMLDLDETRTIISYLPYPHGFEQCLFAVSCMVGMKIGFY